MSSTMPPCNHLHDLPIFHKTSLKTAEDLSAAVLEFEAVISRTNFESVLDRSLEHQHLFEFLISASSEATPLSRWILDEFPTTANGFNKSFASRVLGYLSRFIPFLHYPFSREAMDNLRWCRSSVELAPRVIQSVLPLFDNNTLGAIIENGEPEEDSFFKVKKKAQKSQRKDKRSKHFVDLKPLQELEVEVPTTPEDAHNLATQILQEQKQILELYLSTLRRPDLVDTIRAQYIPADESTDANSATDVQEGGEATSATTESSTDEKPTAYPMVQPMKAALYFDSAEGFGEWRILISTRADRNLREARRTDASKFKMIIKKIKELSRGHFSDDNQKRLNGPGTDIPIFEAKMSRDLRLVYQVDCVPEYDSEVERQGRVSHSCKVVTLNATYSLLKIYGIYTHAQLDSRLWDSMGHQLGRKGREYKRRCTFRTQPRQTGNNVFTPASFPPPDESASPETLRDHLALPREDLDELHSLLVLEKFVTLSQALLNSIIADQDVAHVFAVSPQEKEIIEYPYSCYVLGRSGTGKTTTMLFKMLGIERAWTLNSVGSPRPRQLFVTQSRVLAEKVEEYFSKLLESLATASQSLKELAETSKTRKSQQEGTLLVDHDDDVSWRGDLPSQFSQLKDEHFPLFITFDRLCKMLEADICRMPKIFDLGGLDDEVVPMAEAEPTFDGSRHGALDRRLSSGDKKQDRVLVSYDVFFESYWRHFPQSLIKGLDPSLVYSEFMGVIKGSEQTLSRAQSFLDKDAYDSLSHRTQSTFATQRTIIYDIFQLYLKRKREQGHYDAADRTHAIIGYMQEQGLLGRKVDYLYVDEAQDNLLIDALLLRSLCRNSDGLFWAGDTAQAISVGSSFRFNDLKAFLFRIEERNMSTLRKSILHPQSFQLAVNYRSHGGIVNCAHSVIELITTFWPYAIDVLAQETGVVDGLRPVFLGGWDQDTVRYEQFLFGESGSHIEFGAQQCILVRDEAARVRLRQQVGDIGLIMTLYESKGLEFNDVLLYNFFQDSTVDLSQWRVVLNLVEKHKRKSGSAPRFDEIRHAGVCSELKFLYVAITRARKNMWIVDCSEKSEPMRILWTSRGLIQNCTPGMDVPHLAVSSSPDEWAKSGTSLFQNKRYLQAKHCFERASLPREVAIAHAYHLREQARATLVGSRQSDIMRLKAFLQAADAFIGCAEDASNKERQAYFRNAADCYVRGGDDLKAAKAYIDGREFNLSAKLYRKAGAFGDAVNVVKSYRPEMEKTIADSIIDVARLYYFNKQEVKAAADLFPSYEEGLEFTKDYDLDVARATLLEHMGRKADAAELHLLEGRTLKAIETFLEDFENSGNDQSMHRAIHCLLRGLWQCLPFGISPDAAKSNATLDELLPVIDRLNHTLLEPCDRDEILAFRAIIANDMAPLEQFAQAFSRVHKNKHTALLCLDHLFANPPRIHVATSQEASSKLHMFHVYAQLLQETALISDPCNDELIQRLFGFQGSTDQDNVFFIPANTFFHRSIIEYRTTVIRTTDEGVWVFEAQLSHVYKCALRERLRRKVLDENRICQRARAFSPCLTFAVFGICNRGGCPHEHIKAGSLDATWYNARVRLHLQQILIFHTLHSVDIGPERQKEHRYWLNRLYEALNPPFYLLGTPSNLDIDSIPEAQSGLKIVRHWVRNLVYALNPVTFNDRLLFLTTILTAATLTFTVDKVDGPYHLYRAPSVCYSIDAELLRGRDVPPGNPGSYVVHELIRAMQGIHRSSLSGGILSLRHIVKNELTVNIAALCDIMDHICGSLILAVRRTQMPILHEITMPRSWLLSLSNTFDEGAYKETHLMFMFADSMADLVQHLHQGGARLSYLLHEQADLSVVTGMIRSIFIARICRTMALLGYNIKNIGLRARIAQAMKPLATTTDRRTIYSRYASAQSFDDLAPVLRQCTMDSSMDEMIYVCHETRMRAPIRPLKGLRPIVVKNLRDIPRALDSALPVQPSLRPEAVPFTPNRATAKTSQQSSEPTSTDILGKQNERPFVGGAAGEDSKCDDDEESNDVEELALVHDLDAEGMSDSADVLPEIVNPFPEQVNAASIIQAAYRRHLSHRRGQELRAAQIIKTTYRRYLSYRRGGANIGLSALFVECWSEAQQMTWPHRYYRFLFLGPLPHILLCLQEVQARIYSAKEKAKRRMKKLKHQELEDIMSRITEINALFKEAKQLQQALEPKSALHRRRDIEELKFYFRAVETLIRRCPASMGSMDGLSDNLVFGLQWTAERKHSKKEKPVLNVEEDML